MNVLFSPVTIGGVQLPNRVVMPPMTTRLADPEGYVTYALVAYYEARALGGVGLITVEMGSPERVGRHRFHELDVYDDRFLPGLQRLVGALHDTGAFVSVQLGHGGSRARMAVCGETPIAPSRIPTTVYEIESETVVPRLLGLGLGKTRLGRRLLSSPRVREWLYYGARRGTGPDVWQLARTGQKVMVIGDTARAGKARDAIDGAFRAALLTD